MSSAAQSYSRGTFDRCASCSDVALDAIIQSALYVVSHVAPEALSQPAGDLELSFRLRVRLEDDQGADIAVDEVEIEQSIVTTSGELGAGDDASVDEYAASDEEAAPHSSLEDYQAMIDRVQIAPAGANSLSGIISGRLFGFERLIGPFEVLVGTC